MDLSYLEKTILEALYYYGQMSKQELLYLYLEYPTWILKISKEYDSKILFLKKLEKSLRSLNKKKIIHEYLCDSGYRRRFGIPELSLSDKIQLKLREFPIIENCKECSFPIIIYKERIKHFLPYFCDNRNILDDLNLKVLNCSNLKFIIYQTFFLGVIEKNKVRLPFIDNKQQKPEFLIALDMYIEKYKKRRLTLKFKEVIV